MGAGNIGRRLAAVERSAGHSPLCIVRTEQSCLALLDAGFDALQCDLDDTLPPVFDASVLYYLVPPNKTGDRDERSRRLIESLHSHRIAKLVLISTTGVYGDCDGRWIDESAPLAPGSARAKRRVDSESVWTDWAARTNTPLSILRVGAIYSQDRLPEARLRRLEPIPIVDQSPFVNRIHADDLVQACRRAPDCPGIYNAVDDAPGRMGEYFCIVAKKLGLPEPPQIPLAQFMALTTDGMRGYLLESRRISNQRMKNKLNVRLQYPTLIDGLRGLDAAG